MTTTLRALIARARLLAIAEEMRAALRARQR
jgi:hypothetical protein